MVVGVFPSMNRWFRDLCFDWLKPILRLPSAKGVLSRDHGRPCFFSITRDHGNLLRYKNRDLVGLT